MAIELESLAVSLWELLKTGALGIVVVLWVGAEWRDFFPSPYDR